MAGQLELKVEVKVGRRIGGPRVDGFVICRGTNSERLRIEKPKQQQPLTALDLVLSSWTRPGSPRTRTLSIGGSLLDSKRVCLGHILQSIRNLTTVET